MLMLLLRKHCDGILFLLWVSAYDFVTFLILEYYRQLTRLKCSENLGIPHMSSEDDEYDGYFIPKGTLIIGNVW